MPGLSLVQLAGFRIREEELAELGQRLPGLRPRLEALDALPGLGTLTLAGLTPAHWEIGYHDPKGVDDAFVQRVVSEKPELVAISALTASIEEAYRLSARLRAEGLRTVLGGLHVTTRPEEALLHADAIVVGEGEPVWARLLEDVEAGALAPRYGARHPFDLREAPVPRFDLLGARPRPRFTLQTQRGCPLACEFCGASRLLGPFRQKPAELVSRELEALCAFNPRPMLELADDNTFAGRRSSAALLETLRDSRARWFTEVDWRVGERPELVAALAESGCVQVLIGIESLATRFDGMGPKAADPARILAAIAALQERGVAVLACFVVGGDDEDRRSLDALAAFLEQASFADVQLTLLTPFPGTPLFERLQREGRLLPERGWAHHTLFDVTFRPKHMEPAELERAFRELVATVHRPEAARRRAALRRAIWSRNAALRDQPMGESA